jgi:hypothetical protein
MELNLNFDEIFKSVNKSVYREYGTKIRIIVPKMSPICFNTNSFGTLQTVLTLLDQRQKLYVAPILILPEHYMSPFHRRGFINTIVNHPEIRGTDKHCINIVTQDVYILFDCMMEIIKTIDISPSGELIIDDLTSSPFAANLEQIYTGIWG